MPAVGAEALPAADAEVLLPPVPLDVPLAVLPPAPIAADPAPVPLCACPVPLAPPFPLSPTGVAEDFGSELHATAHAMIKH
ncbi:MAG TPA: hypothetical protein VFG30_21760 [Polyangiales bacterium]|nr:hypothetical protein [Polyangiales bacterium]